MFYLLICKGSKRLSRTWNLYSEEDEAEGDPEDCPPGMESCRAPSHPPGLRDIRTTAGCLFQHHRCPGDIWDRLFWPLSWDEAERVIAHRKQVIKQSRYNNMIRLDGKMCGSRNDAESLNCLVHFRLSYKSFANNSLYIWYSTGCTALCGWTLEWEQMVLEEDWLAAVKMAHWPYITQRK